MTERSCLVGRRIWIADSYSFVDGVGSNKCHFVQDKQYWNPSPCSTTAYDLQVKSMSMFLWKTCFINHQFGTQRTSSQGNVCGRYYTQVHTHLLFFEPSNIQVEFKRPAWFRIRLVKKHSASQKAVTVLNGREKSLLYCRSESLTFPKVNRQCTKWIFFVH